MSPWIPVAVTVVLGILGLAVQGLLLAYFIGRMKEHQEGQGRLVATFQSFTEKALSALTERMGAMDSFATQSQSHRAELGARISALEANTDGLPKFREEFAGFRAAAEAHQSRVESDLSRLNMAVEGLQRQVANLAIHGGGTTVELPATTRKGR